MKNEIYVSEVVTTDIVEKLVRGENYLIGSEMSSGKNYWVRNILLPYALESNKRTLILSHRNSTLKQQLNYLKDYEWECKRQFKGGMFELKTYQAFQKMIQRNDSIISSFDYIVCDEAHYFIGDSSFNTKTELAFNYLNNNDTVVKILMTGTSDGLYYLPWKKELRSLKEANYNNNSVKDLFRYEEDETIKAVIKNEKDQGNKVLMFHKSIDTANDFEIGNTKLLYSGNQESSKEFKQITETAKFDCDLLNTTTLMTEATEIKDKLVKTIVFNGISDIDTFVQGNARVRGSKVNVYYKRISKRSIQAKLRFLEKQLHYYDEFVKLGDIEFIKEYGIDIIGKSMKAFYLDTALDPVSGVEHAQLRIHQTGLANLCYQYETYEFMNERGFEAFFDKYYPNIYYIDLEQLKREEYIQLDIINNYVDKKIFKEQQQELVNVICSKYGLRGKNGSKKVGMKTINSFFEENNIPFMIQSKRVKIDNKLNTVWILNNLN